MNDTVNPTAEPFVNPAQVPSEPAGQTTEPTTQESATPAAPVDLDIMSRYGEVVPDTVKGFLGDEGDGVGVQQNTPPAQGGTAPPADGQGVGEGQQPAQQNPAQQPATTQQQQQPQGGQGYDFAALQAQISNLTNTLQGQQTQTQQPQGGQQEDALDTVPDYNFEIPDQLVNMLNSEDPGERKTALGTLIRGVSQTIHQQLAGVVKEVRDSVPNSINDAIQMQQFQSQVNTEFYGKYPDLNTPEKRQVVHAVALNLMRQDAQMGVQPAWTPQFMERVGQAVNQMLGVQQPAQPAAQPNGQEPAQPVVQQQAASPATFGGATTGVQAGTEGKMGKGRTTQQDYMDEL